jgi:hypothetical protein
VRAEKILADPQYQRSLPSLAPDDEKGSGPSLQPQSGDVAPAYGGWQWRLPAILDAVAAMAQVILYLLVAGATVLIGGRFFRRIVRENRTRPTDLRPEPALGPAERERKDWISSHHGEAERLASEGRWAEALHATLLQAIHVLAGRLPWPLPPSSTSRELLRLVPLSAEARQAFAGLVRAVELSLFGGAAVGPEEYQENRERFRIVSGGAG